MPYRATVLQYRTTELTKIDLNRKILVDTC